MSANPTEKPASVAAFEDADLFSIWAVPLDGIVPLSPAVPYEEPQQFLPLPANDEILALDWSFQHIPSEGFHPQLSRSRKAA